MPFKKFEIMGIKIENIQAPSAKASSRKTSVMNREIHLFGSRFSNKSKEQFYGELSVLLNSGINLKRALDLIIDIQKKQKDRKLIQELSDAIVAGSSLSEALENNKNFTPYEYHALKIGEQTGQLHHIAENLSAFYQRKSELKRQLISSLSYPMIVLTTAVLVVIFMLSYVVPMFVDIFKQNRVELPWLTRAIVSLSDLLLDNGLWLLALMGIMALGFRAVSKKKWYYRLIGRVQLKLPVFGTYLKKIYMIQFTQAMALLTQAKVPLVNGIRLVRQMIQFYPLEHSLIAIEKDMVLGKKLDVCFAEHPLYDKKMIALLKVAEETNRTDYIFQKLYDQYSTEIKYQGQLISNALNFLLTLFVGLIVGIILVAMYLPMFKLSSIIG
ncbi:MAG: type II secretion system F family protein [Bacteroidota bacterium]